MDRVFNLVAPFYKRLTANRVWRDSVREMARHFPPGGATLRLLDVGCGPGNSALEMLRLRPDVSIVGMDTSWQMLCRARRQVRSGFQVNEADAHRLPFAAASFDTITAHGVFYLLTDPTAFLTEALRVLRPGGRLILLDPAAMPFPLDALWRAPRSAPSILAWHAVSYAHRRVTAEGMARQLDAAGFVRVLGERAAAGYGVLSRGEKPYIDLTPLQRIASIAAADADSGDLLPLSAERAAARSQGRALYLLIQQTPNKPVWSLKPGDVITWGAATVLDQGRPVALAFTSLPKAVEFMQPAVRDNLIVGINKVAKFENVVAARWDFPVVLNPSLDTLRNSARFTFPGPLIAVDAHTAVSGEE